ncbi:CHAP domain-containing protein [Nocardioides sp. Bht2]|uniref:CHAP domain-containing protein n=1 Tax=Nocardioides sp. Bht2 TaxID=3392297 RepID=UPI0039B684EA
MLVGILLAVLLPATSQPASATNVYLCMGYDSCAKAGYSHAGYKTAGSKMWWQMYSGHNCTNYAAYRMVQAGYSSKRPWTGSGNATNWGVAMKSITNKTPVVGAVAWWKANSPGVGSAGHVAYVERVVSPTEIIISEDSWGGDFSWRRITTASNRWPTGFIHFLDLPLTNTTAPSINGTLQVGQTLAANYGRWANSPTAYAAQWFADGAPIAGATKSTYVVTPDVRTKKLTLQVTATRPGYKTTTATSAATAAVAFGQFEAVKPPEITGLPEVDEVLSVDPGTWAPAPSASTVQWLADGKEIAGATGWELPVAQEQIDAQLSARVTAKVYGYRLVTTTTAPTAKVLAGVIEVEQPAKLTGKPTLGTTLKATPGTYSPADATAVHTWLRNGVVVGTGPSYTLGAADLGKVVSLRTDLSRAKYRATREEVALAAPVTVKPTTKVATVGKRKRAVVKVKVSAPGAPPINGLVRIRVGAKLQEVRLVNGWVRVVFTSVPVGTRKVQVRFLDTGPYLTSGRATTVKVLK